MTALFLLTLAAPLLRSEYGLPVDPQLDRPVAVEARIELLPELLARIGKEVGVTLTVERRMDGLKATVFTPPRPLRLTLAGLASVFDAEWTPLRGGGYRLEEAIAARNAREAHLVREDAELWAALREDATGEEEPSTGLSHGDRTSSLPFLRRAAGSIEGAARAGFLTGEASVFVVSEGERPGLVAMRYEPRTFTLRTATYGRAGNGSWASLRPDRGEETVDSPFFRRLAAWRTDPNRADVPVLRRPLGDAPPVVSRWSEGKITEAERLETLHRRTGLPIVAEAFRVVGSGGSPTERTLGEVLRGPNGPSGWTRIEDGALLQRPARYWRERSSEPPEAAMVALEGPARPDLDRVAEVVGGLTTLQAGGLRDRATRHDLTRLFLSVTGLRLWAALSPSERGALRRGESLSLSRLSPSFRGASGRAVGGALARSEGMISLAKIDPARGYGDQALPVALGLLGQGPGGPWSLRVEGDASPEGGRGDRLTLGLLDGAGNGLRLFVLR